MKNYASIVLLLVVLLLAVSAMVLAELLHTLLISNGYIGVDYALRFVIN